MTAYRFIGAALALGSVTTALQLPLQLNPSKIQLPWVTEETSTQATTKEPSSHVLVDTDELQDRIHSKNLYKRAEDLYEIAKLGEDEFGHPTRVIGGEG